MGCAGNRGQQHARRTWWKTGLRRQVLARSGRAVELPPTMSSHEASSRRKDTSRKMPLLGSGSVS